MFFEIIDNITNEISTRFRNIMELTFLELLNLTMFNQFHKKFPDEQFTKLTNTYAKHFDIPKLRTELKVVYDDQDFRNKTVFEIFVYLSDNDLFDAFGELTKLSKLFFNDTVNKCIIRA